MIVPRHYENLKILHENTMPDRSYYIPAGRRMDHLVTVNPYFVEVLQEYGIPAEKISYIPNVVSEVQFRPLPAKNKPYLRKKYHLKEGFTVLCVGQLQKRKGFLEFLAAAERLPQLQFRSEERRVGKECRL